MGDHTKRSNHLWGGNNGFASDFATSVREDNEPISSNKFKEEKMEAMNSILNIIFSLSFKEYQEKFWTFRIYRLWDILFSWTLLRKLLKDAPEPKQTKDYWGSHSKRIHVLNIFNSGAEPTIKVGIGVKEKNIALIINKWWKRKRGRRWDIRWFPHV